MAKKMPMGDLSLAPRRTAAVAVAEVAGADVVVSANPRRRGFVKAMVRLEPRQLKALKLEAIRRAQASSLNRLDLSEIVREQLDRWLLEEQKA